MALPSKTSTAMYKTIADRKDEEKRVALLWMYIASKGLLPDFTEYYKLHRSKTMEEIDKEFKSITKDKEI